MTDTVNTDVNDDDTPPSWMPSELGHALPADTHPLWLRLEELTALSWPTAGEQVERRMLVVWLKPTGDRIVMDTEVFTAMCDLFHYSPLGNMSMLKPVYDEAAKAWANLSALAAGKTLEPARPEFEGELGDDWRDARCEQSLDWWETTMRVLDRLVRAGDFNEHQLMSKVGSHEVRRAMHKHFVEPLFDGPMAIGASIYLEPRFPGGGLGLDGQAVYALDALAHAVNAELEALEGVDSKASYEATVVRIDFLWQLLKGFVWAGTSQTGNRLTSWLAKHDDVWTDAVHALVSGREVINAYLESCAKPVSFNSDGRERSLAVRSEPVAELIARMTKLIDNAKREKLENML